MPEHSRNQIFKATYSGVPVYEMICKSVAVMRRRADSWLNATQILKVAGFDKPQRTRVLEREVQKAEHEKVQGGYGKYQGTWVPLERGIQLARQYNIETLLRPLIDFQPSINSPPLAPKHVTAAPVRQKRKDGPDAIGTRGTKRTAPHVGTPSESRASSPASVEGSLTASPSDASSSSRTPSPLPGSYLSDDDTRNGREPGPSTLRKRKYDDSFERGSSRRHGFGDSESVDPSRYGDIVLEYFISDAHAIPNLLINPPSDFDANMIIDEDGHTPLHWACAMGRTRVVKLLLSAGADIFKVNKAGQTALMRSVMFANNYDVRKFPELYELLHRSTLNIDQSNRTVFHHIVDLAASKGKTHAARYYTETLLGRLSDFPQELADIINFQDEEGDTALIMAARCRSKRLVKLLIDHGADPKIANNQGKTCEDYILEDARLRSSPLLRPSYPTVSQKPSYLANRLPHSTSTQRTLDKYTHDVALAMDNLATSFDNDLLSRERDLTQARLLLDGMQAELGENRRIMEALKAQSGAVDASRQGCVKLEAQLVKKMEGGYRAAWDAWLRQEDLKETVWRSTNGKGVGVTDATSFDHREHPEVYPAALSPEDISHLESLYQITPELMTPDGLRAECDKLRRRIEAQQAVRREKFDRFVKLQMESGTGGRMADYHRLIGAGCGGIPPADVDRMLGSLLDMLEAEEPVDSMDVQNMDWQPGDELTGGQVRDEDSALGSDQ